MTDALTFRCPSCGDRPVEEFSYQENMTRGFWLSEEDGEVVAVHEYNQLDEDTRRVSHDICNTYLESLPTIHEFHEN